MAHRHNHYETAFQAYLRARRIACVPIDESRRAVIAGASLKSLDFIVPGRGVSWLVDVKGRRFPAGRGGQYWKNWSTCDDLRAMSAWEELFGVGYQAMFVFAYAIVGDQSPLPQEKLFAFHDRLYAFLGVRLQDYACYARPISAAWQTVALTSDQFRQLARPIEVFLDDENLPTNDDADARTSGAAAIMGV
jgi:hypothetical protein